MDVTNNKTSNKKNNTKSGNMFIFVLGIVMFLFGAYQLMQEHHEELETHQWAQVDATIVDASAKAVNSKSGTSYCYDVHINYVYNKVLYDSFLQFGKYGCDSSPRSENEALSSINRQYPKGGKLMVRVSPKQPTISRSNDFSKRGLDWFSVFILVFGLQFIVIPFISFE